MSGVGLWSYKPYVAESLTSHEIATSHRTSSQVSVFAVLVADNTIGFMFRFAGVFLGYPREVLGLIVWRLTDWCASVVLYVPRSGRGVTGAVVYVHIISPTVSALPEPTERISPLRIIGREQALARVYGRSVLLSAAAVLRRGWVCLLLSLALCMAGHSLRGCGGLHELGPRGCASGGLLAKIRESHEQMTELQQQKKNVPVVLSASSICLSQFSFLEKEEQYMLIKHMLHFLFPAQKTNSSIRINFITSSEAKKERNSFPQGEKEERGGYPGGMKGQSAADNHHMWPT
ncbi:hypothetical protein Tco_0099960 [Tanacetum coccineum]